MMKFELASYNVTIEQLTPPSSENNPLNYCILTAILLESGIRMLLLQPIFIFWEGLSPFVLYCYIHELCIEKKKFSLVSFIAYQPLQVNQCQILFIQILSSFFGTQLNGFRYCYVTVTI